MTITITLPTDADDAEGWARVIAQAEEALKHAGAR